MQTFLPFADFEASARALDWRRLGKQRVECAQILKVIDLLDQADRPVTKVGWVNHPAVIMWRHHPQALRAYSDAVITEWIRRGYNNSLPIFGVHISQCPAPPWLGDEEFHRSHRSNLLRKDPVHYRALGWTEPDNLPYLWPVA